MNCTTQHLILILIFPISATSSGDWKFVVFGDSPDPATNTTTGINPELNPIAKAIAAEKPEIALYIGDLINGADLTNASSMQNNYTGQFRNWMTAVSPIHNYTTGIGIPLYVIRGNHEENLNRTDEALLNAYLITVASGMMVNGPPGEEKLTYSFMYNGAKFIGTDDYIAHNGLKETVNQSWVNGQLTQDTRPFMFVFGHSPAYLVDMDAEDLLYSLPVHPAERDTFWKSMVNNNVSAYLCGHAHVYVGGKSQGLQQIVSGNGGASMQAFDPALADPALTIEYPLEPISLNDQKVGYLIITVHETSGTFDGVQKLLNTTTQLWEIGDTFSISIVKAPVASFTGTPISGTVPLPVQFTDTSTGSPIGRAWFFGDETYTQPWTLVNGVPKWSARFGQSSVLMPDGSIVLMGGTDADFNLFNDVWRFQPAGSSFQTPSHTYTSAGTNTVALTATNSAGSNLFTRTNYITATSPITITSTVGVFRNGTIYLAGSNTNGGLPVNSFNYGMTGDKPITGKWTGTGIDTIGIFRSGNFFLASSNTPGGGTVNAFNFG